MRAQSSRSTCGLGFKAGGLHRSTHPSGSTHEGVELVMIDAADDVSQELGIDLQPEDERLHDADLFRKLRIPRGELPVEPLRSGKLSWRTRRPARLRRCETNNVTGIESSAVHMFSP
jgi:hypothetical protein